jgi:hypothetical protein
MKYGADRMLTTDPVAKKSRAIKRSSIFDSASSLKPVPARKRVRIATPGGGSCSNSSSSGNSGGSASASGGRSSLRRSNGGGGGGGGSGVRGGGSARQTPLQGKVLINPSNFKLLSSSATVGGSGGRSAASASAGAGAGAGAGSTVIRGMKGNSRLSGLVAKQPRRSSTAGGGGGSGSGGGGSGAGGGNGVPKGSYALVADYPDDDDDDG